METFLVERVVRGYHAYKDIWTPNHGDTFNTKIEQQNSHDRYAVAIVVDMNAVGNVSPEFSKIIYCFIRNSGAVTGTVWGKRKLAKWMLFS